MSKENSVNWDLLELICGDCGGRLEPKQGQWNVFYGCSNYPKCYNRMNADLYENILDKITEMLEENTNLTGLKWSFKSGVQYYLFEVVRQQPCKYTVSVINVKKRNVIY